MLENPMITGLQAHQQRLEAQAERLSAAYEELRREFITALFENPTLHVQTPCYRPQSQQCVQVVGDVLEARPSLLFAILALVTAAAQHEDSAMRLPAQAIAMNLADYHAGTHAQEVVNLEGGLFDA